MRQFAASRGSVRFCPIAFGRRTGAESSHHGRRAAPPGPCPRRPPTIAARDLFGLTLLAGADRAVVCTTRVQTSGIRTINARVNLSGGPALPYNNGMDAVTLPPELEQFAAEAISTGRYRDLSELVSAGMRLLQRQDEARAELLASVLAAKQESDREGYLTGDEVAERVRATIARKASATA